MSAPVTRLELLNPDKHRHLRLRPPGGDMPYFVQIVIGEFAAAAATCPILFTKEAETGNFFAGALFAFKPGESFIQEEAGHTGFTPLSLQRDGFFISGEHIAIDLDNPRFSEVQGEPLFDAMNQPSLELRRIQRILGQLHSGIDATDRFIRALTELRLVEPIDISLNFDTGGEKLTLQGLYTVSLDSLRTLGEADAMRLLRAGYLQLACTMSTSLEQIPVLARLRDQAIRKALLKSQGESACGGF
jgi:hypothetical protein